MSQRRPSMMSTTTLRTGVSAQQPAASDRWSRGVRCAASSQPLSPFSSTRVSRKPRAKSSSPATCSTAWSAQRRAQRVSHMRHVSTRCICQQGPCSATHQDQQRAQQPPESAARHLRRNAAHVSRGALRRAMPAATCTRRGCELAASDTVRRSACRQVRAASAVRTWCGAGAASRSFRADTGRPALGAPLRLARPARRHGVAVRGASGRHAAARRHDCGRYV